MAAPVVIIKVPCSSANIGPGFDVIGLALSIWLELQISPDPPRDPHHDPCRITYSGCDAHHVDCNPSRNLITQTALYVLRCHGHRCFPHPFHLHIVNPIPLGRGLGSSGAAVIAGAALANELARLNLPRTRLLDFALMIERHPDNVAAALHGGLVASYLHQLDPADLRRREIPLAEVLPTPQGGLDTGLPPPLPPANIARHLRFPLAPEIRCIAVIPDRDLSTATARAALPDAYPRADVVANLQRIALLPAILGQSPPDPDLIADAMRDRLHQPYRQALVPGLADVLRDFTPQNHPGLLGVCLSGAGPTLLALATRNFDEIANHLVDTFRRFDVVCRWQLLDPAMDGLTVEYPAVDGAVAEDTVVSSGNAPTDTASAPPDTAREKASLTYKDAGVDIDAGNRLVAAIADAVKSTRRPGADADIGGFGGALDLRAAGYTEAPLLIQAIDGIGTKLQIACALGAFDTVGIDLVAMNVNDLVVQGAEPLSFLDYYACSRLDVAAATRFVAGVAAACRMAGCALIGGETAEMPALYRPGDLDAAGAATGALPAGHVPLPHTHAMRPGDVLLGLPSTGLHSNGFSLARRICAPYPLTGPCPWASPSSSSSSSSTLGAALLTPTRIYVRPVLAAHRAGLVLGAAHITGGGLWDNLPRALPADGRLAAHLDARTWRLPAVLRWLKRAGPVDNVEFARTWNAGLGMVLVVRAGDADRAMAVLREAGEEGVVRVGELRERKGKEDGEGVVVQNMGVWDE